MVHADPSDSTQLLEVRLNNFDQLFRASGTGAAFVIRIDDMHPDMVLNDLSHEAVHCSPGCDHQMKDVGAALFFFDRSFERLDLTENTSHSVQELGFLFDGMRHIDPGTSIPKGV